MAAGGSLQLAAPRRSPSRVSTNQGLDCCDHEGFTVRDSRDRGALRRGEDREGGPFVGRGPNPTRRPRAGQTQKGGELSEGHARAMNNDRVGAADAGEVPPKRPGTRLLNGGPWHEGKFPTTSVVVLRRLRPRDQRPLHGIRQRWTDGIMGARPASKLGLVGSARRVRQVPALQARARTGVHQRGMGHGLRRAAAGLSLNLDPKPSALQPGLGDGR